MPSCLLNICLSTCDSQEGVPDGRHLVLQQWQLETGLKLPPAEGQALACWASVTVLAGRKPSRQAQSICLSCVGKCFDRQNCWLRLQHHQHTVNDAGGF